MSCCFKSKPPANEDEYGNGIKSKKAAKATATYDKVYETGKLLGEGAFSKVKEATNKETRIAYAVKIINKRNLSPDDAKGLKQEISILQEIDHPNIIKLHDIFVETLRIYLVTEIMTGGELFDRIVQKEYYNENEARDVCKIMFGAIAYCHERKVAHRDLKPENLLLFSREDDKRIKIADFGFAKKCISTHCLLTQCGTPGYVAPEILNGIPYGTQADMWSLGVIMYILLAGYPPFNGKNQKDLFKLIRRGRYEVHEQFWGNISDEAKGLVSNLLVVDPKKRLTAESSIESKWMNQDAEQLGGRDLRTSLDQFRKFNAKRKVKQAVLANIAAKKMSHFIGLGVDQTFGFSHAQGKIVGCEPMSSKDINVGN
jgi:calcium/calmodulin-dependent protein kinase I